MDNDVNQTVEVEATPEEGGLFDDIAEETESTPAEVESTKESSTEAPKEASTEPFLKIKYNKEEKGLSLEEATELAQKGMNYDNIYGKLNALNGQLEKLAKANNMDVSNYISSLENAQRQFEMSKEMKSLKAQYPAADDGLLKELAEQRISSRASAEMQKAQETKKQEESQSQIEIKNQVEKFNKRYPNLEADKLDPQVYDLMKDGYTLLEAYSIFKDGKQAEQAKLDETKMAIDKKNAENKKRGLGNISSSGSTDSDDFMSGFLNNF